MPLALDAKVSKCGQDHLMSVDQVTHCLIVPPDTQQQAKLAPGADRLLAVALRDARVAPGHICRRSGLDFGSFPSDIQLQYPRHAIHYLLITGVFNCWEIGRLGDLEIADVAITQALFT